FVRQLRRQQADSLERRRRRSPLFAATGPVGGQLGPGAALPADSDGGDAAGSSGSRVSGEDDFPNQTPEEPFAVLDGRLRSVPKRRDISNKRAKHAFLLLGQRRE